MQNGAYCTQRQLYQILEELLVRVVPKKSRGRFEEEYERKCSILVAGSEETPVVRVNLPWTEL